MSISLRKDTDNPLGCQLTFCPRCGGEGRDLILTGTRRTVIKCPNCGCQNFGSRESEKCGRCQSPLRGGESRKMEEHEKLPGGLCESCEKEVLEHKKVVAEGGLHFNCKQCNMTGVIKAQSPSCMEVRKKLNLDKKIDGEYPPAGIEFEACIQHGGEKK